MGLAGSFGGRFYQCIGCGYTQELYATTCPKCLSQMLPPAKNDKRPAVPDAVEPVPVEKQARRVNYALPLAVLAVAIGIGSLFLAPHKDKNEAESAARAERDAAARARAAAQRLRRIPRRVVVAPVKRPPKPAAATIMRAPGNVAVPRRAAPMKLWEETGSED